MYGEIAAILTNVCFAISFVLARRIEDDATPIFQNAIRATVGFLTYFMICVFFGILLLISSLSSFLILMLMMSVLFTVVLGDTAYLHSQKILGPAKALALTTTSPFFTILFATLFLNRPFSILMIFSGILIGIGVIIITKEETNKKRTKSPLINTSQNTNNQNILKKKSNPITLKGIFWAVFAAISWAIGIALSDFSVGQVNIILDIGLLGTMIAMMIRFLFASTALNVIAIFESKKKPIPKARNTWKILILSAILSYSIGSLFFGEAVHIAGASFMSLISTALPLFTIPFSYLINKETISKKSLLGVIVTLIGVILIFF